MQNLLSSSLLSKNLKFCMGVKMVAHMREEHRLRVLRRIFGPRRDEVTREWRKLHNEELNDLYSVPNSLGYKIEENEMGGACSMYGGEKRLYRALLGKPEGERPLGRPRLGGRIVLRWIFRKWDVEVWTRLSWLRIGAHGGALVNVVMNPWVP